jgi:hypothetical protein
MEVSGQLHTSAALTPGNKHPVHIGQEAGWAPKSVWALWRREETLAPARNRTPAVDSLVGIAKIYDLDYHGSIPGKDMIFLF